jgi:hypothetical protein
VGILSSDFNVLQVSQLELNRSSNSNSYEVNNCRLNHTSFTFSFKTPFIAYREVSVLMEREVD